MSSEIERLSNKIDELSVEMKQILFYLYNDDKTGTKGIVQTVREMGNDIAKIKRDMLISKTKRATLNTVFGAVGGGLVWIIKHVFF